MSSYRSRAIIMAACLLQISAAWLCGQVPNEIIYSNSLQNGWANESWATVNLANTSPVQPHFSNSISVFCTEYAALQVTQTPSSSADYTNLNFWLNGGPEGGQVLTVTGTLDGSYQTLCTLPPLASNTWQEFTISLSALGVADQPDFDGIWIWNNTASTIPTFYVGSMMLVGGVPPPPPPPPPPPNNYAIYSNALVNGWANASYNITLNYANATPVYSGSTESISATINAAYGGIGFYHSPMSDTDYGSITFWINGGLDGGQNLQMYGLLGADGADQGIIYYLNTPVANTWVQYTVPLSALGVANTTDFSGFVIQDSAGGTEPTFYLDDVGLVSATAPSVTLLAVNANHHIRTADARWFGLNAAIWDGYFDTEQTVMLLTNMGIQALRLPGGSASDDYHWVDNESDYDGWQWATSVANFTHVITNINAETMITVNYGSGTQQEAAAWVAYCNAATTNTYSLGTDPYRINWQTAGYWARLRAAAPLATDDGTNFLRISHPAPLGFKYWEIGNEEYGTWETDSNSLPHDPFTYAARAQQYISMMKAVDPTIKVGVVVTPGVNSYLNYEEGSNGTRLYYTNHPAVDPVTGQTNYGWTPVLMASLKMFHVTPDFAIFHNYPQNPGGESDAGLLASSAGWASYAGDLRGIINDYMGTNGTNVELVCTENNSVSSSPGKQSVSLVNGLFKIDGLAQLMQTEFNGLFWWDLRNGQGSIDVNLSDSLYGWREYGDYGVVNGDYVLGSMDVYPTYYTTDLMTYFAQTGDTVVSAASDWSLLSTYGVRRQDGSLTVLTVNKDPVNTLVGQVSVTGFTPSEEVVVYSYGIPQDDAVENGSGSPDIAQSYFWISGTAFNYPFPPYSATVMVLAPPAAQLQPMAMAHGSSQFVFQLQGETNVPYVLQCSTNLMTWTPVSTNTLVTGTLNITNSVVPSQPEKFWRAVWQP
ncbi:MAG: alpha-L-arabinofuranosidase [Limisphaerales bacterium]